MAPSTFQNPRMRKEVHWVAKDGHDAMRVGRILPDLRDAAASDRKRYEYGRSPISNGFCFRGHSNPPSTRSRLPKNFCQP